MKDIPFVELTKVYDIEEHCKGLHKTRFSPFADSRDVTYCEITNGLSDVIIC